MIRDKVCLSDRGRERERQRELEPYERTNRQSNWNSNAPSKKNKYFLWMFLIYVYKHTLFIVESLYVSIDFNSTSNTVNVFIRCYQLFK